MPHIGNDGFSDCDKLCSPGSGYSVSCQRICPGYAILTPSPPEHNHSETPLHIIIPVAVGCVLTFAAIIVVYCLRNRIKKLWKERRAEPIRMPVQVQHNEQHDEDIDSPLVQPRPELSGSRANLQSETGAFLHVSEINGETTNENITLASVDSIDPVGNVNNVIQRETNMRQSVNVKSVPQLPRNDQDHNDYVDIQSIRKQRDHEYVNLDDIDNRDGHDSGIPSENTSSKSLATIDSESEKSGDELSNGDVGRRVKYTVNIEIEV